MTPATKHCHTMTKIDCLAKEPHHIKHVRAVWDKLPKEMQGQFYDKVQDFTESQNSVVLVSAYGDLKVANRLGRKAIFMEHGVGLYYNTTHASYAGSTTDRECVILRLSPNERHAAMERTTLKCPVEIVGVPKMDAWAGKARKMQRRRNLAIAISFHFDATICPETRSSWRYYMNGVEALKTQYKIMGHGHPRIFKRLARVYTAIGIKPVPDFEDVMRKADIYICDNSSTIYEFAFLNKPVILLNNPLYRRGVEHEGCPRFWKHSDIGYNVDSPKDLAHAIEWTYANWENNLPRQQEIVKEMFTYTDGHCAERAVEAIIKHIDGQGL